jgi:transcriptional regulator with XRE-family HTH domain
MTLGERIRVHRGKSGLSQEKIAELVGISRQAVTKWESGQSIPSMANLIVLAEILGVSLEDLTGGVNDCISIENTLEKPLEKKKGTVKLISAIILAVIGIMTTSIVSNMSSVDISRLSGVEIQSAHLVRLGFQTGGGMAIFAAIVLFVLYKRAT